ncbi:MAG TPA: 4-(cytidine 5'-diphospho)-2-C-methyl-D-erythritol kinase [Arthrobacter bacterium]|jgi:4-diphosphocytidyl-2-C-methyl-D-erythritol kinase|nr:4-(cytidine 5'-diphospho)-2-C-methyl-D-erythritol kinase [Arthrobacter sp.]HAP89061.1 4-(cytidine 5'-diphospho)-2-C-methyl-D-erythritol kinase [Arthrobacter sp.]HBH57717.1 4-(cytidine 5'-diphospho)-2-C-methyl-D-erythritol kinase [Arthrobacter sp.]HCB59691.1 4-(cytidine 5'-diphospho)-2-C-methyl-D-erythritol kinase [Arthrobacter sp.]HCC41378.1 4-(cytidine 5'-diphospho)-2-C-methyl-D-erythritol kinase [Arthrobacter sp.]
MKAPAGRFSARTVRVKAPGKVNVSLDVGPLRPDGYHSVASVYLAVSLYEEVAATNTETPGITVSISPASTLDLDGVDIPLDEKNLAYKAAAIMADVSEHATGVHLEITKRVPVAGGMGGGSADAAATLLACDALWNSGLSRDELAHLAAELGADVPFSLLGGTAVGLGLGDELSPALVKAQTDWVLVAADYGLPTPEVYRTLDRLRDAEGLDTAEPTTVDPKILQALRSGDADALSRVLVNDLQRASIELAPALRNTLGRGEALGALAGIVSGSGPTVALLTHNPAAAESLAEDLRHYGLTALAVHGPVHGARIISDTLL